MRVTLEQLRPVMERTQTETNSLVLEIEKQEVQAAVARTAMEREQAEAASEMKDAKQMRDECDTELANAMPPLMQAINEMKNINKKDIAELKSLHHPPTGVRIVMECICMILGRFPNLQSNFTQEEMDTASWKESQHLMSDFSFLQQLLSFDKDHINDQLVKHIHGFTAMEEFRAERMEKVSRAATCLCNWACALDRYFEVENRLWGLFVLFDCGAALADSPLYAPSPPYTLFYLFLAVVNPISSYA
jgi:dynein heavy chain